MPRPRRHEAGRDQGLPLRDGRVARCMARGRRRARELPRRGLGADLGTARARAPAAARGVTLASPRRAS